MREHSLAQNPISIELMTELQKGAERRKQFIGMPINALEQHLAEGQELNPESLLMNLIS